MNFIILLSLSQIVLSALIISLGLWKWNKNGSSLNSNSLFLLYISITIWLLTNAFEILSMEFETKYFWGRFQYIPLVILPAAWFYFAHSYSKPHYILKRVEYVPIIFTGVSVAIFALTNDAHHLFWHSITIQTAANISYLDQQIGIVFVIYIFYMLMLIFIGIYQITRSIRLSGPTRSWQSTILLVSIVAIFASVVLDVSNSSFFPEPELASIVIAFVIPIVGHTLEKLRYADIMPAAYYQVFEHIADAVIIISPTHRIIDMNKRARLLSTESECSEMASLKELFPFLSSVPFDKELSEPLSVEVVTHRSSLIFDISISPTQDHQSPNHSNIIVLRDVTERHMRERLLIQRNEELEILNQISEFASSTPEIADVLAFVVELSCLTFKCSRAYIAKVDQPLDQLTVTSEFINPTFKNSPAVNNFMSNSYRISEDFPSIIKWLNNPVEHNISHFGSEFDNAKNQIYEDFFIQSALSFPIRIKGDLYGFISIVESEKHRYFEPNEIQLLQSIAHQLGSAIENAQLYAKLTQQIYERTMAEEQLRNSLEEKDTLLKEVHHRVKNNLQVISSLLRLQLTSVNNPQMTELIQDSQSRIHSMALVHELLYQSEDFSTIDLGEYLEFLTHSLMASYQSKSQHISINTQCYSFNVTIEIAITCGLLLNEIVSNAIKHAFPTQEIGTIDVSINPLDDQNTLLIVQDDGIGLQEKQVADTARSSLGLKLIDSFINQLNAQVKVSVDSGTRYEITIPTSNLGK